MIVVWGIAVLCTLFLSSCKRPEVLDNSTLVNSARNVALTFGPAYVPFFKEANVSDVQVFKKKDYGGDSRPQIRKQIGRKFYTVTFTYDSTAVKFDFGMRVLLNDLPREEKEGAERFSSLEKIAEECDIITFHVPLYKEGKYKTFHLADEVFFQSLKRKPVIINTSRGEVIQTDALLKALNSRMISDAIIDVWEHEPEINRDLLEKTFIGTPHIAGYSADGKANATRMSLDAICNFFQIKGDYEINAPAPVSPIIHAKNHEEAVLQMYNPTEDSNRLKNQPELFETLRGDYPLRREEKAYIIKY